MREGEKEGEKKRNRIYEHTHTTMKREVGGWTRKRIAKTDSHKQSRGETYMYKIKNAWNNKSQHDDAAH
jgi:hypothetical protein